MIAEASVPSLVEQKEQHASDKEVLEVKEALSQAEAKIKTLEVQIENLQKVRGSPLWCPLASIPIPQLE